jgi:ABC-type transport system involved in cytochrome c biogenesis permease component
VSGLGETGHLLMLGAMLLLALVAAPVATSAALRISAE